MANGKLHLTTILGLFVSGAASAQAWQIDPEENILTLGEGETFNEVITVTVPAGAVSPKADVYLLADTTGSMGSPIAGVKAAATSIVANLRAALPTTDLCFGVGNYKDFPYDSYAFQHQLSSSVGGCTAGTDPAVTAQVNLWAASGGVDGPEGQLYALDRIANDSSVGWRSGAKKILVWFGDAPGHDAVCAAISGLGYDITEASATADLVSAGITVLAFSTTTGYANGLDDVPTLYGGDYISACGSEGGTAGQATRIGAATGGSHTAGVSGATIAAAIQAQVEGAVATLSNLSLQASGGSASYVTLISPAAGYADIDTSVESDWEFDVAWEGECLEDGPETLYGTIDAVADGAVVAQKTVELTLPACNEPPVAVCADVVVSADEDCLGCASVDGGSYDPDGDPITIEEYPACDYELGTTVVELTVTDDSGASDTCFGSVTVEDDSPPVISCGTPASGTITPPMAPISFTATVDDNCGADVEVVGYNCWGFTGSGKVHSKLYSCAVRFVDDKLTILDAGGEGDHIDWVVEAVDDGGNVTTQTCSVVVVNPGKRK